MTLTTQGNSSKTRGVVDVFEYFSDNTWRVHWKDQNGVHHRSKECSSLYAARVRANNHPEWPFAITREGGFVEVVERG